MSLETRAARAVRSLRASVAEVSPISMQAVVRRHRMSFAGGLAGAVAIIVLAVAGVAALPDRGVDHGMAAETTTETTATTSPTAKPSPPSVVLGAGGGSFTPPDGVFQVMATSAAPVPYTEFIGVAPPASVVSAHSSYGSASVIAGASGEFRLKVLFEDPPPGVEFPVIVTAGPESFTFSFTWTWNPADVAITAHQTHGSSSASAPYEVYYGTAPPGTEITAASAYGSGDTTADSKGQWSLKVFFSGAPSGQAFPVTVTVGPETFQFSFTSLAGQAPTSFSVVEVHKDEGQGQWMKFLVSGASGTAVQATSPYGSSAVVTIDAKGQAWVKVFFTDAPLGQQFQVSLKVNGATHPTTYAFTSTWDPADAPITINVHKEESHPFIKVWGTAPPGTAVSVSSPYGSGSGSANSKGEYLIKVEFKDPLPPADQPFDVTITVGDQVQVHSFTYTPK